jgi:MFS transporter, putative metabolite:H+ symporter
MQEEKKYRLLNAAVIVAALGYFVDIYDLLLFTIVRKTSITAILVQNNMVAGTAAFNKLVGDASNTIINYQMIGLLIGGIIWGVLADKKGRLSVLFASIVIYSIANFITGYVTTIPQYAWCRFIAGLGLAGELGAGIALVSELLPKDKRGIGTSLVAGIGLSGAVVAYFVHYFTQDWRLCYKIGGVLGIALLVLRVRVSESGMFSRTKIQEVSKGNFLNFFTNSKRFKKYILSILIGLPTWYVIGVLINRSDGFAEELYGSKTIDSGRAIMFAYAGISIGDIVIGLVSQQLKSRKKALYIFYGLTIISISLFFSGIIQQNWVMYTMCFVLGFSTGFWAIFVTMGAEQFGTNLRATAATTIPNMVRGSLPLINWLCFTQFQKNMHMSLTTSGIYTAIIVIGITLVAVYFIEETFHKDLDYIETT